jgi:crossover junction endodeoxyribonuclease RusA
VSTANQYLLNAMAAVSFEFFVAGEPRPKQSFRVSSRGGGFQTARVKSWQADVGWAAQQAMRAKGMFDPLTGEVNVILLFKLGDKRRVDLDNLSKGTLDGIQRICFEDDSQITDLHIRKVVVDKASAGVTISIRQKESLK